MTQDEQTALDAVRNVLDSYSKRNVENCMSAVAASKPILLLGTNDNEVFKTIEDVRDAFNRDFSNMTNIRWGEYRHIHVEAVSTLASVIVELPISYQCGGKEVETHFRYALTLTKEGEQWKICAGMTSVPFKAGTYSF
ncbi:nuclear transport factor 2 family protein [Methylobacter sp. YRD-M1]|uniref:nuclear transport factor 2 family protein n=1 Tax=Methylobacter sp. YRD-M1 TaxID=2911520 RepID=UPI00227B88D5|nr:nuclear transport factor 2 family protein [Methylobacter sp. YRD-M1]WAK00887.1 nuclear transport factor 2 family protein [Methylobacter sp. YRD-M1]